LFWHVQNKISTVASEKTLEEERRCPPGEIVVVEVLQVLEGAAYVGLIAGAIFAVYELRDMKKSHKLELMMRMNDSWCRTEFLDAAIKIVRANFTTAAEAEEQCSAVSIKLIADSFDWAATYVREGLVDADAVPLDFEYCYEKLKPWLTDWEQRISAERYADFKWMADEERSKRLLEEEKNSRRRKDR
jgi:hypothetical protein